MSSRKMFKKQVRFGAFWLNSAILKLDKKSCFGVKFTSFNPYERNQNKNFSKCHTHIKNNCKFCMLTKRDMLYHYCRICLSE